METESPGLPVEGDGGADADRVLERLVRSGRTALCAREWGRGGYLRTP